MDEAQKMQTQQLRDELKTALDNNDIETLKRRIGELEQAAAYMQQQGANPGAASGSNSTPGSNPDDVVDGDYKDGGDKA